MPNDARGPRTADFIITMSLPFAGDIVPEVGEILSHGREGADRWFSMQAASWTAVHANHLARGYLACQHMNLPDLSGDGGLRA